MSQSAAAWIPLFPEEEIPFILQAILRCAKQLRKKTPNDREDHLTDRLRDLLDRDRKLRKRPTEIFREVSVYDREKAKQKPLGRTDIAFVFSTGVQKPWPYFTIECKRLHVMRMSGRSSLIDEYIGRQGMRCFIDERYSRGLANGAMLGYVFDNQVSEAWESIAKAIAKHHEKLLADHNGRMRPTALSIPGIQETHHRIAGRLFIMYHLLVPV